MVLKTHMKIIILPLIFSICISTAPNVKGIHFSLEDDLNIYPSGDGNIDNPYHITNITQLQEIRKDLSAHYVLVNNINANATSSWNWDEKRKTPNGFEPIGIDIDLVTYGHQGEKFTGTLNGHGFRIYNLYSNYSDEAYYTTQIGLFGYIGNGGLVSNLIIQDVNIKGIQNIGGIAGFADNCNIINCSLTGNISGNFSIGGIVGKNNNSLISNCYVNGNILGRGSLIGGIIGNNVMGKISDCTMIGNVSGSNKVGGIVGSNSDSINNCYATVNIKSEKKYGGIVGVNACNFHTYGVRNSFYCINDTTINGRHSIYPYGIFKNQFNKWLNDEKNLNIDDFLLKKSNEEFYEVSNVNDLKNLLPFAAIDGYRFKQTKDIDLSGLIDFYIPIFLSEEYDGNHFSISNVTINKSNNNNIGLFGFIGVNSTIKNVNCLNCNILGYSHVGGVNGVNYGSVLYCISTGNVVGNSLVGGLVGNNLGEVSISYSACKVSGIGWGAGGLIGCNENGNINNCYAIGNVSSDSSVGGLVGKNAYNSKILNSYSIGSVNGTRIIGGLIGNSYTSKEINCFWDKQASVLNESNGGIGKTTYEMTLKKTYTTVHWDFDNIWSINEGKSYPYFIWDDNDNIININQNDNDFDGIQNADDAFPDDPSASIDTDGDHMPDKWNPGMNQSDSTSDPPLELDPNPDDPDNIPPDDDGNETPSNGKSKTWIWASGIAAVVIVVAVAVVFLFHKKKDSPEEEGDLGRVEAKPNEERNK